MELSWYRLNSGNSLEPGICNQQESVTRIHIFLTNFQIRSRITGCYAQQQKRKWTSKGLQPKVASSNPGQRGPLTGSEFWFWMLDSCGFLVPDCYRVLSDPNKIQPKDLKKKNPFTELSKTMKNPSAGVLPTVVHCSINTFRLSWCCFMCFFAFDFRKEKEKINYFRSVNESRRVLSMKIIASDVLC